MGHDYERCLIRRRGIPFSHRLLAGATALLLTLLSSAGRTNADELAPAGRQETPVQLTLPAPTGPHTIGTVSAHLVDYSRQDPYWSSPHPRELMVSLWYPARVGGYPERFNGCANRAPWMPSKALEQFRPELANLFFTLLSPPDLPPPPPGSSASGLSLKASDVNPSNPISLDNVRFPITHAVLNAPVKRSDRPYPVVLFAPGYGINREQGTALVEDLASHGYVVVTIGHTYESAEVVFPDGRVVLGRHDLDNSPHLAVALRRNDTKFVLDKIQDLAAGVNPDAENRKLPDELGSSLDLSRIGMFGHSLGGATAVQIMANDDRVIAGMDLDGTVFPDIDLLTTPREEAEAAMALLASRVGNRPFMFMTSGGAVGTSPERFFFPFVDAFWNNLPGWRRYVTLLGASHFSYTDNDLLLEQLIKAGVIPPSLAENFGLPDLNRTVAVQRAYIRAFFDRWLRDRDTQLLDGQSPQFPEIIFY
jgi:dienelactone hydrolase